MGAALEWIYLYDIRHFEHHTTLYIHTHTHIPYILKSNPHPFYSFRGLKNQMRIRFVVMSWILEKL